MYPISQAAPVAKKSVAKKSVPAKVRLSFSLPAVLQLTPLHQAPAKAKVAPKKK